MIDIHSHILPGLDDGSTSWSESLAMANAAVEEGIHTIIATPHHQNGRYINERNSVDQYIKEFQMLLREQEIPLTVLAGQENRVQPNILKEIDLGGVAPLGQTNYILLELPNREIPHYTYELFDRLQLAGYIPIIAHPERNKRIKENPNILLALIQRGALAQVTAASIVGEYGSPIQKFTSNIIEANLAHFIASDAHNTRERGFCLLKSLQFILDNYGEDVHYMFVENAELMIKGQFVHRLRPKSIKQRKYWFVRR